MVSEEAGQNLNCTLTFIKPKMNDSGLYTVKETVDESRGVICFVGSFGLVGSFGVVWGRLGR